MPMILLGPLEPAQWSTDDRTVWTHLDCSDAERRRRLTGRRWDSHAVEQAVADAHALRSLVTDRIVTDGLSPAEAAAHLAGRVAGAVDRRR